MTVRVDHANLDRTKIREDIRRQMDTMKGVEFKANAVVTVDRAKLKKGALRKSIQAEFDKFQNIKVNIDAAIANREAFQRDVRQMVDRASRNKATIAAGAHTLEAAAQLRYVSRPRFVDLFVRVNQTSATRALAALAALSGARLAWTWLDDLAEKMGRLDKSLPSILGWTTGLTSLGAALAASVSGLVGLGQGLFTILPALLTVPGLILNSAGSLTALIVALKYSKQELASLGDEMTELGSIIRASFWDEARQPILDLVNGLMPQLRNSFRELSAGIGQFTGAMATAFGQEFAGGRLESIFANIAEGWRILGTGAPGFAGAMVSLSNIAAKYTPRLAGWLVRQANTFDAWLDSISNDGRLESWMEGSIRSMYDLWDATKGFAGVLQGLWTAAEAGGSMGLAGFADMMQEWERVVKGADFQKGLTAVFRGSHAAMDAFGGAVRAIGRMFVDMAPTVEKGIRG